MKRCITLLAFALFTTAAAHSQETDKPYLELVRAMRAKGYDDLALDYLDGLTKKGPKAIQAFIPLEKARVRMDMADREGNMVQRAALYAKARQEFLDFAKARPNDPLAAEAELEAARILVLEGRSLMRQGLKLEEGDKVALAQKAAARFKQASGELKKATAALDAALPKAAGTLKQSLADAQSLATLEGYRNQLDLASTYEPLNLSLAERGKLITAAMDGLKEFADKDAKNPIANLARAYVGKAYLDVDNPNEATKAFESVLKTSGPEAADARRMASFFQFMQGMDPRKPAPAAKVQDTGEEWLKNYPNHHGTAEGTLLRYHLAGSMAQSAQALFKPPGTPPPAAKALYTKALNLYRSLENPQNEFTEEASGQKIKIMIALNVGTDNINDIKEFSQAFIAAQAQVQKMADAEQKMYRLKYLKNPSPKEAAEAKDLEAKWPDERKQYLGVIRDLLNHARSLADDKTSPAELAECYGNLVYVYTALGQPEKGVVMGEYAARQMPHVTKAAAAAAYTLQAYSQMISEGAGVVDSKFVKTDENRMMRLAQYMEKTWPNDTNTDAARHQVGVLMLSQRRAKEAAEVLSRVSAAYKPASSLTDARWWWAVAAMQMINEPDTTEKEKKLYQDQTRTALQGIPEVPATVSSDVAHMYVQAKIQYCNSLFEAKKFDELDKQATMLQKKLAAFDLPDEMRGRLKTTVDGLAVYAQYGRASAFLNADQSAKAQALCDEVIPRFTAQLAKTKAAYAQTKKQHDDLVIKQDAGIIKADEKTKMEELKQELDRLVQQQTREGYLLRAFLSVALRASVQTGNIARAQQLLTTLRNAATETVGAQVYVQLVAQLKEQIEELKAEGKTKELNQLMKNFNGFLEAMTKQNPTPEVIFFIANAFRELDKPNDAANMLDKLANPGDKDEKALEVYRAGKLMQVQLYRQAKNFKKAGEMVAKIEGEGWAKGQIMKEKAFLYQDQEIWGGAAVAWRNIMERLAPHIQQPKIKEQYYEGYFNYIKCLYKYAVTLENPKLNAQQLAGKKQEYIERAAKLIIKVEDAEPANMGSPGLKEEYEKLLSENPPLKKEYDKAKAAPAAAVGN